MSGAPYWTPVEIACGELWAEGAVTVPNWTMAAAVRGHYLRRGITIHVHPLGDGQLDLQLVTYLAQI